MGIQVINSLPYVIKSPGVYRLAKAFNINLGSGNAIEVQADNVTIDLMNYAVDNRSAGPSTTARGVSANGFKNCTVRNGDITGFLAGIYLRPGSGPAAGQFCAYVVEGITLSANVDMGITVKGLGNIIRNNLIVGSRVGIFTGNLGASTIINNSIYETVIGIELNMNAGSVVDNNRLGNTATGGPTESIGISVLDSSSVILRRNSIYSFKTGIRFDGLSWGMYIDNVAVCCATPFFAPHAVAAGTTNYSMMPSET